MKRLAVAGGGLYLIALILMFGSIPSGVQRAPVEIEGPDGKPCTGTLWTPGEAKGVMLIGHGVTSNRGAMAMLAKAFANNGYHSIALDFWGHGRSRVRFDWMANREQLHAWFAWAQSQYPGLPVGYLGHSMGGFAGSEALTDDRGVGAFVSLGALPRRDLPLKTLIALGRYEELFTPEEAHRRAGENAEVLVSPFSNHMLENWDPVLISGMVDWVDTALGLDKQSGFPWLRWAMSVLAVALGTAGALLLASAAVSLFRRPGRPQENAPAPEASRRRWSLNPYRLAGRLLGSRGYGVPPLGASFPWAIVQGIVFASVMIVLLTLLLDVNIFTSRLDHPPRLLTLLILTPIMAMPLSLGAYAYERIPLPSALHRFAVPALTRAVPLLFLAVAFRYIEGLPFLGMILGILAFILIMLAAVHALATQHTSDCRAGVMASSIALAWVIAFWLPVVW